ncbi:hypothetical protein P3L51_19060 [Streptomyces sp. PSRA5]|uniref:hypothetical protein n=1 Tax=Streptomyces panacea TaxID=3035064 RepID=UPI00339C5B79
MEHLVMLCSMKISHDIRREHGGSQDEIEAGMAAKSKEFAASGNRVYLPLVD